MNDTFADQVTQQYRSVRAPNALAQRVEEDFARGQHGNRFAVPVFASLLIGGIALAVFGPGVKREQGGVSPAPLKMSQVEVSHVTAQVGQFARLSMGQIKIPASNSLVVRATPVAMPTGMPKSPDSNESAVRDG
jgi:hypothetical protein